MRDIGKKFARYQIPGQPASNLRPLALQLVHPEDSVLGPLSRWPQKGLNVSNYPELIQAAFHRHWWDSPKVIRIGTDGTPIVIDPPSVALAANEYTVTQYNFSLFFGLAIQLYESTLVADNSPTINSWTVTRTPSASRPSWVWTSSAARLAANASPVMRGGAHQRLGSPSPCRSDAHPRRAGGGPRLQQHRCAWHHRGLGSWGKG